MPTKLFLLFSTVRKKTEICLLLRRFIPISLRFKGNNSKPI